MTGFLIALGVFIAVVVVMGIRHDRRQRGLTGWSDGRKAGNTRLDNQTRADKWST